jgi:hypothetical protein
MLFTEIKKILSNDPRNAIDVTAGSKKLLSKQTLQEITNRGQTVDEAVQNIARAFNTQKVTISLYQPNGSSFRLIGRSDFTLNENLKNITDPLPQSNHLKEKTIMSPTDEILKLKNDLLTEQLATIKIERDNLIHDKRKLQDENFDLTKQVGISDARHEVELMKVSFDKNNTLSGVADKFTSPEVIDRIFQGLSLLKGGENKSTALLPEGRNGELINDISMLLHDVNNENIINDIAGIITACALDETGRKALVANNIVSSPANEGFLNEMYAKLKQGA